MKPSSRWRLAALLALALLGGAAILFLPLRETLVRFLGWVQGVGFWGPVVVAGVYVAACLLFVPGSVLTLGAGFLFGVARGTAVVSVASTIGASLAFLLGRTLARGWVESRTAASPRFQALDRAVGNHGFKIVLLTRLSPAFPFNLLNYAYGVTRVSFWKYVLASWIGMLPGTVMYVYFGSAVKSLADLAAGKVEGGMGRNVLFGVGLLATVVVTILITRAARKAMREAVPGAGASVPADPAPAASPPASSSVRSSRAFWVAVCLAATVAACRTCVHPTAPPPPPAAATQSHILSVLDPGNLTAWTEKRIGSKRPVEYRPYEEAGRKCVRAMSKGAASFLIRHVQFQAREWPIVEWEWRVVRPLAREDLDRKTGNDCCARILFGFKGDWSRAGYFERRAVDEEISKTGHEPPGTLLVYVWSLEKPAGTVLNDAHLGDRARVVVAVSGREGLGRWQRVRRNLLEDARQAFGGEPPPVTSVSIMTDSDDTQGAATADYGPIEMHALQE